jgi:hypothetical protein
MVIDHPADLAFRYIKYEAVGVGASARRILMSDILTWIERSMDCKYRSWL